MGLITLTNIEDGQDAVANALNERFGKIVDTVNGNIDSQNLKNNAVTREKIAPRSVTSDKLFIDKYIDENGWTVTDYGSYKEWTITKTGTPNVNIPAYGVANGFINIPFPEGVVNRSDVNFLYTFSANDRVFILSDETAPTGGSGFSCRISNWYNNQVMLTRYSIDIKVEKKV